MVRLRGFWLALVCCCWLTGCGSDDETKTGELQKFVLDNPPKDIKNKLELNYENKVQLWGYELAPSAGHRPGKEVKVTMYWRLTQDLPEGWSLFTHVLDGAGLRLLNIDNVGPLRRWKSGGQAMPPGSWEVGKVYVDEQRFKIPEDTKSDRLQIVAGVWKAEERLKVVSGAHDRENRGIVATIQLTKKRATSKKPRKRRSRSKRFSQIPTLKVYKLKDDQKLTIDGVLNELAWRNAARTRPLVDVKTGKANRKIPVGGRVKVLYDDEAMYLGFDVNDRDVVGGFNPREKDPHLWTKDAVEIMVDPDGNGDNKDYYEIQINPQNLVFDSRFDSYNKPRGSKTEGPFGHEEWSAQLVSAVTVTGTLDESKDKDKGYIIEAKIPWKSFDKAKRAPPKSGDIWRMNFYAIEDKSAVAWSPILSKGSFHKAKRFGRVVWTERAEPEADTMSKRGAPAARERTRALERRFGNRPPVTRPQRPAPQTPRGTPAH